MDIVLAIKKRIKRIFNLFGLEIQLKRSKKDKERLAHEQLLSSHKWLTDLRFKTIIDIGANEGQFAHRMRSLFPDAQIISFEPVPQVYDELCKSFGGDSRFSSYNLALGEKEETTTMYLNEYSPSSSLLKMKEHVDHFTFAVSQTPVEIKMNTLDRVLGAMDIEKPYLVKIDVQGFEESVINGGKNIISGAEMVITEVSFSQLYEDQALFDGIYLLMKKMGFRYTGNYEQLNSPIDNRVLQADAIFCKVN